MNQYELCHENRRFEGTAGISKNNRQEGFLPAFRDETTGRVELARTADGAVATMHVITWLPGNWAKSSDSDGGIVELKDGIVCGFVRDGRFYSREEVAALSPDADD